MHHNLAFARKTPSDYNDHIVTSANLLTNLTLYGQYEFRNEVKKRATLALGEPQIIDKNYLDFDTANITLDMPH